MTAPQLKTLLRFAIRRIASDNELLRQLHLNPRTGRIEPASAAREYCKTRMWLARARKAVAGPKAARRAK